MSKVKKILQKHIPKSKAQLEAENRQIEEYNRSRKIAREVIWPVVSQTAYRQLLKKAAEVVFVSKRVSQLEISGAMQLRNEWMVNNCTRLVALWDGTTGGTYNCVAYANSIKKPVTNLCPELN